MPFTKVSQTQRLAYWEDGQPIHRTAALGKSASYFAESQNTSSIDVASMLQRVAGEYDISPNPKDYLFEAVRAVTAGVPNENGDAFHKNELLRYDHRLRQAVYQSFILKPHHVNHRADNPKTARGVILDAHYNDSAQALDSCPRSDCGNRTAEIEGRDSTGLYCRKCGSTVKDEFVEILIAVDRAKDPNFAEGVRTGVLNATSMGCVCDSTTCNVCDHVAYNRNEFCTHIRGGNKKKTFRTAGGEKIAFEWCNNVIFTEDSRVDQPADPRALQQEILSLAARKEAMSGDLSRETDLLIIQKQITELQARVAQITDVEGGASWLAGPALATALAVGAPTPARPGPANYQENDRTPIPRRDLSLGDNRLPGTVPGPTPIDRADAEKNLDLPSAEPLPHKSGQLMPQSPNTPEVTPGQPAVSAEPGSIQQFVQEQDTKTDNAGPMSKEEMGILDAPAVSPDGGLGTKASVDQNILDELDGLARRYASQYHPDDEGAKMDLKFKTAYSNVRASITSRGNCRVFTPAGTLFVIQPTEQLDSPKARKAFAMTVLAHIAEHGLIPTIRSFEAAKGAKLAQILEHHVEDFDGGRKDGDSKPATEGGDQDHANARGEQDTSAIPNQESDRKDMVYEKKTMNDSMLGGHQEDFEGKNREDKKFPGSVQDGGKPTQSKGYPKKNLSDSPLDNVTTDHQKKVASEVSREPGADSTPSAPSRGSRDKASRKPGSKSKASKSRPSASKSSRPSSSKPAASKPPSKTATPPAAPGAAPAAMPPAAAAPPAAPAPVPGAPAAAPGMVGDVPMDATGLAQHWVAIEAMIAEMAAMNPEMAELAEKAKQVAAVVQSGGGDPMAMGQAMEELEQKLAAIGEGMEMPAAAMMVMDQMLAGAGPEAAAPVAPAAAEGLPMTASKKGLPSFIKNKRGGSSSTSKSRPSVSSKERANSEGGHGSKKATMEKEAAMKNIELRMERLYKGRIAKLKEEAQKREAAITAQLAERFKRALKLAAKRQALNLEASPLKAAFADVLLTPMDLGGGDYYPGMDEALTVTLVERSAALGMNEFVEKAVERAAEFMKLSEEAFGHIEKDAQNLQPVTPAIAVPQRDEAPANHTRAAARDGNLQLAPSASDVARHDRSQLQAALGSTKIQRQRGRAR